MVTVLKPNHAWLSAKERLSEDWVHEAAAENDQTAEEFLNFAKFGRGDKCSRPLQIESWHPDKSGVVGEAALMKLPCGTARYDLCPECSEFQAMMRRLQITTVLNKPGIAAAFLTLTAPGFGRVHNSQWTAKDEHKAQQLKKSGEDLQHFKLTTRQKRNPCPCGERHDYRDPRIGTPLNPSTYDYIGQTLWTQNLPNLKKSLDKSLQRSASRVGIKTGGSLVVNGERVRQPNNLSTFTVSETQKRGVLHLHMIIVVDASQARLLPKLVRELEESPPEPTALIREEVLKELKRPEVQNIFGSNALKKAVPYTMWKGRRTAATKFGKSRDIQIIKDSANPEDGSGVKKVGNYVAKYLTKLSANTSVGNMMVMSSPQKIHAEKTRATAVNLLGGLVIQHAANFLLDEVDRRRSYESGLKVKESRPRLPRYQPMLDGLVAHTLTRQAVMPAFLGEQENEKTETLEPTRLGQKAIMDSAILHRVVNKGYLPPGGVFDRIDASVLPNLDERWTRTGGIEQVLLNAGVDEGFDWAIGRVNTTRYIRAVKTRLNKLADNAGFTGTFAMVNNWPVTMKDLKAARMERFAAQNPGEVQDTVWGEVSFVPPEKDNYDGQDPWTILVNQMVTPPEIQGDIIAELPLETQLNYLYLLDVRKKSLLELREEVESTRPPDEGTISLSHSPDLVSS